MQRNDYFPSLVGLRAAFFAQLAHGLPEANATLGMPAPDIASIIADCRFCEYGTGAWRIGVREAGPAATASLEELYNGTGAAPMLLFAFTAPPLPQGDAAAVPPIPATVPVAPGALQRIFAFVQTIKARPGYTEAIGLMLGIVGSEAGAAQPLPTFTLEVERAGGCECVKVKFKKNGRQGVVVFSRRGPNGVWEMLAIDLGSPYLDQRPLLVAGTPEVREFKLQYYDDAAPVGDFTPVQSVTVAP